ncbi:MAG: hypothetical protein WKF80_04000 [Thermomicrobiales bacterium]
MAVTVTRTPPDIPQFIWPTVTKESLRHAWMNYDLMSDSLMIAFSGTNEPAVPWVLDDGGQDLLTVRYDPGTHHVTGLFIEDVLTGVVPTRSAFYAFFDLAAKRGVSPETLRRIRDHFGHPDVPATPADEDAARQTMATLIGEIAAGHALEGREPRTDPAMVTLVQEVTREILRAERPR